VYLGFIMVFYLLGSYGGFFIYLVGFYGDSFSISFLKFSYTFPKFFCRIFSFLIGVFLLTIVPIYGIML